MNKLILILSVVGSCWAGFDLGGHGLTFGEISLDHEDHGGSIDLGESGDWQSGIGGGGYGDHGGYGGYGGYGGHGTNFIPVYKSIGIPVLKKVPIYISQPSIQPVAQPYKIIEPVQQPVPYPVEKIVFTKVEKEVPTPVEKPVPVTVEKPVPITIVKTVPVLIPKPIPFKVPFIKTIVHRHKH